MKKLLLILCWMCICPSLLLSKEEGRNYIVIHSATHTLELYDENASLLKIYPVGVGKNGPGKTAKGDEKSPLGHYHISYKASAYAKEDGGFLIEPGLGYNKHNYEKRTTSYAPALQEGDKGESLWLGDYGGFQAVFLSLDYPNALDRIRGYTGLAIAIHATLNGGIGEDSSKGCFRMDPSSARELYQSVVEGASVFILPD